MSATSRTRSDPGGGVVGFAIVLVTFVLGAALGLPAAVYYLLIAVGALLALRSAGLSGFGLGALVLAAIVFGMPLFTGKLFSLALSPDLKEPIPVPSGYGFKLDPASTNLEHLYNSEPIPRKRAQLAAVAVLDHYVGALKADWTVVERDETSQALHASLKEVDSSRGIGISVLVVRPMGRPAVLDLRIQALLCTDDVPGLDGRVMCRTAPVSPLVRYPGGGPLPAAEPSARPLREPVPLPPGYGFAPSTESSAYLHAYDSTTQMSFREAARARRAVMAYYRDALKDWTVVETGKADLEVKNPGSTDGVAINATWSALNGHGIVTLEIQSVYCPKDYWCL